MTSSTYNNGVSETRAYNTDNTLASINFAGASIGNLTYGWDANKNTDQRSDHWHDVELWVHRSSERL